MKALAMLAGTISLAVSTLGAGLQWQDDYDKALAAAKTDNKIVIVDVYTDWCGWCKKLDKDVYADAGVQAKLAKDFVTVKINPEKSKENAEFARKFGVYGYPHILFLDAGGKKISEIRGYIPAKDFAEKLVALADKSAK
jgi:thiol:disulfide interchange protein